MRAVLNSSCLYESVSADTLCQTLSYMNEFDPTNREYINHTSLQRFEADIELVETYADLYIALARYMADEFNIPDHQVHVLFEPAEHTLPSREVFEENPRVAREQARLVLIKVALPLAEDVIDNVEDFSVWLSETARVAMGTEKSGHQAETCMKKSKGKALDGCSASEQCPVKYTAYKLIENICRVNKTDVEYSEAFRDEKIAKTLEKIIVARDLGLYDAETAEMLSRNYIARCLAR
jgi:hypothetical protein